MKPVAETACIQDIQKTRLVDQGLQSVTAEVSVRTQNVLATGAIEYSFGSAGLVGSVRAPKRSASSAPGLARPTGPLSRLQKASRQH